MDQGVDDLTYRWAKKGSAQTSHRRASHKIHEVASEMLLSFMFACLKTHRLARQNAYAQ